MGLSSSTPNYKGSWLSQSFFFNPKEMSGSVIARSDSVRALYIRSQSFSNFADTYFLLFWLFIHKKVFPECMDYKVQVPCYTVEWTWWGSMASFKTHRFSIFMLVHNTSTHVSVCEDSHSSRSWLSDPEGFISSNDRKQNIFKNLKEVKMPLNYTSN